MDPRLQMSLLHFQDQSTLFPDFSWVHFISFCIKPIIPLFPFLFAHYFTFSLPLQKLQVEAVNEWFSTVVDMGSCVSVHKSSESTMKLQWSTASKTTDSVLNESPVKENTVNTQQFKPQLTPSFRELGMIFSSGLHIYILGSVLALIIRVCDSFGHQITWFTAKICVGCV